MSIYPRYNESDSTERRIKTCIEHELNHGGNTLACARAIMRDIRLFELWDKSKDINCDAVRERLASMDSGFWTRGGHSTRELVIAVLESALSSARIESLISDDQRDAKRWRKFTSLLQSVYDGETFQSELLDIDCYMQSGWRNRRTMQAELRWEDIRDEPLDFGSAIDAA